MERDTLYACALCGTFYESIADRSKCEQAYLKKQEEEERKAAETKKAAEYEARVEEVNMAFKKAYELRDKLMADYGEYYYKRQFDNLDDVFKHLFGV